MLPAFTFRLPRHHFCGLLALLLIFQATLPVFGYPFQGQQVKAFAFSICNSKQKITVYLTQTTPSGIDSKHQSHCPLCLSPSHGDGLLASSELTLFQIQSNHSIEKPAAAKDIPSAIISTSHLIRAPPFLGT